MSEELTCREAGRMGGNKRKGQGCDYRALGKAGGATTRDRHGRAFYAEIGKKGGERMRDAYGHEHFVRIGQKGGARVRELVERGKQGEKG